MGFKLLPSLIFTLFAVSLIFVYWFLPLDSTEFSLKPQFREKNYNFTPGENQGMQFYENLRYRDKKISYKIDDSCTLQKKYDMELALEIIENKTILDFYPASSFEEILVACEDKIVTQEKFFVAGEGGPVNITKTENFNVILNGGILLLKDSSCQKPNIAIHELLHALGFDHSPNPNNIMYNISKCNQEIGEDIINAINGLYSVPSYPDLSFEDASALMRGKYLDLNISIRNNGLADSKNAKIIIYADEKEIKEIPLEEMKIGYGVTIVLGNIFIPQINVNKIEIKIEVSFNELDKNNNAVELDIKNK